MNKSETYQSIADWARSTFGEVKPTRAFNRMVEEVEELDAYLRMSPDDRAKSLEECADVYIVLCQLTDSLGGDLQAEVNKKMAINRARKWRVQGDGTGYHV